MGKIYEGIMGLVVGDALGVPVEFKTRDTYQITTMTGYGTYNQPIGTWSDDSSMVLATLESIGRLGRIEPEDIMNNFCKWYVHGDFTPYGIAFDIGGTTRKAIVRFATGCSVYECGGRTITDNGNGALMRILPVIFAPHSIPTIRNVYSVGALTHGHHISQTACVKYIDIAHQLLNGEDLKKAIERNLEPVECVPEFDRLLAVPYLKRDEIKSTGYVVDTLEAALWCLWNTDNYKDCVLEAVNLGNDTDTIAAVAGGLAGIYYGVGGEKGIPEEWIDQIARKDWIKELCDSVERGMPVE